MTSKKTYTVRELSELVPKLEDRIDLLETRVSLLSQTIDLQTRSVRDCEIFSLHSGGVPIKSIAKLHGLSEGRVSQIIKSFRDKIKQIQS